MFGQDYKSRQKDNQVDRGGRKREKEKHWLVEWSLPNLRATVRVQSLTFLFSIKLD